jgi:cell division protein FtsB
MLDIHWTLTVHVPELLTLGDRLVAELSVIQEAIHALTAQQAAGQEALSTHLTAIETEIAQLNADTITQAQLDHLAAQIHAAAAVSARAGDDLRTATERVQGMVPEAPPA